MREQPIGRRNLLSEQIAAQLFDASTAGVTSTAVVRSQAGPRLYVLSDTLVPIRLWAEALDQEIDKAAYLRRQELPAWIYSIDCEIVRLPALKDAHQLLGAQQFVDQKGRLHDDAQPRGRGMAEDLAVVSMLQVARYLDCLLAAAPREVPFQRMP